MKRARLNQIIRERERFFTRYPDYDKIVSRDKMKKMGRVTITATLKPGIAKVESWNGKKTRTGFAVYDFQTRFVEGIYRKLETAKMVREYSDLDFHKLIVLDV